MSANPDDLSPLHSYGSPTPPISPCNEPYSHLPYLPQPPSAPSNSEHPYPPPKYEEHIEGDLGLQANAKFPLGTPNMNDSKHTPLIATAPANGAQANPESLLNNSDANKNPEDEQNWAGFTEQAIRNGFVRKVFGILLAQLVFTILVVCLFIFNKKTRKFVKKYPKLYFYSIVTFLCTYFALACCKGLRRHHPSNLLILSVFTIALTYMVAAISSFNNTYTILIAIGICSMCCLSVMIFSSFTKFDFTSRIGTLCMLSWVLFFFGIVSISTYRVYPIMHTVYSGLGAMLFMLFLALDTQRLMGRKKNKIHPEEYVYATLQLYLDIINMFFFFTGCGN